MMPLRQQKVQGLLSGQMADKSGKSLLSPRYGIAVEDRDPRLYERNALKRPNRSSQPGTKVCKRV